MARRVFTIRPTSLLGGAVASLILFLVLGTLGAVIWRADAVSGLSPYDWAAVRFTVFQAALSAILSVAFAIPVARALARRQFWGRNALITLLGAPFILPVIVAVLGLISVFGRNGIVNDALAVVGIDAVSIFGLQGVLIAHVFFNLPLATRLLLQGWLAVPNERFRLAASLNFDARTMFLRIEWPLLRDVVPGAFMLIFLICTTSFAVALALGGGPKATTIELAIYQAFRLDFNLGKAATLAIVQFVISATAAGLAYWVSAPSGIGAGLDRTVTRFDRASRVGDSLAIGLAAAFLIIPLFMIMVRGIPMFLVLPDTVWLAALRSICVALLSTGLAVGSGLVLALWIVRVKRGSAAIIEGVGYLTVAASPLVMGTGLYLVLFPFINPFDVALIVTSVVNAAMSLPFLLRGLIPALRDAETDFGRLADSLGMSGWARVRLFLIPRARRAVGFGAGLAAALSMGDLGVIALFSDGSAQTLPLQLYALMGAYRMEQAAGAALLLVVTSLMLFWIFDRGGRSGA